MNFKNLFSGIFIGIVIGILLVINFHFFSKNILAKEVRNGEVGFINPLLECNGENLVKGIDELNISKSKLVSFTNSIIHSKKSDFISVYVRDMNNGPWIGINEKEEFIGGSLLKTPLMIAILKKAEDDPTFLDKKVKNEKEPTSVSQYFYPSKAIEVGKEYSIKELLEYMIYYSDNNAAIILSEYIDKKEMDNVFEALGLGAPEINKPYSVNTKNYAGFFRILFNSSYLEKKSSQMALEILSKSEFDRGITRNLPKQVKVAHKFGTRSEGEVNQLHNCGIVYYPKHPYLLCIMTRGKNFDDLADSIAKISEFIYKQINN